MIYPYLKLIHVAALVLWLGPAIGAYWILIRLGPSLGSADRIVLEKRFEEVLRFEHVMFIALIASGAGLYFVGGWSLEGDPWLLAKLLLVGEIALVEAFDVWISHVMFRKAAQDGNGEAAFARFFETRRKFYLVAIPVLAVSVPVILHMATVKP